MALLKSLALLTSFGVASALAPGELGFGENTLQLCRSWLPFWGKVASVHLIFNKIQHLPRRLQPPQTPAETANLKLSGDCAFVGIYGDQEFTSWFELESSKLAFRL